MNHLHHCSKFFYISLLLFVSIKLRDYPHAFSNYRGCILQNFTNILYASFVSGNFEHSYSDQSKVWKFQAWSMWGSLCKFPKGLSHWSFSLLWLYHQYLFIKCFNHCFLSPKFFYPFCFCICVSFILGPLFYFVTVFVSIPCGFVTTIL